MSASSSAGTGKKIRETGPLSPLPPSLHTLYLPHLLLIDSYIYPFDPFIVMNPVNPTSPIPGKSKEDLTQVSRVLSVKPDPSSAAMNQHDQEEGALKVRFSFLSMLLFWFVLSFPSFSPFPLSLFPTTQLHHYFHSGCVCWHDLHCSL
jgi:hypothetical protein